MVKVEWKDEYEYKPEEWPGAVCPKETRRIATETAKEYVAEMQRKARGMLPEGFKLQSYGDDYFCFFEEDEEECPSMVYADGNQIILDFTKSYEVEEFLKRLLKETFGSVEWEELTREQKECRRRIEKIKSRLTSLDYKILEMRSQGLSLWSIATSLGVTMAKVRYSLQKMALIPELAEKLGDYRPLPRSERFRRKR